MDKRHTLSETVNSNGLSLTGTGHSLHCHHHRPYNPEISPYQDPEGILGSAQTGHIARLEFKRRLEKDAEAREAFEQHVRDEAERRRARRQSRVLPDTAEEMIEYFLDTEAQELEFEIARLRPRLNQEFFSHLKFELGQLRFAVSKTQDMEDRLIELEALQKALLEGTEAYDNMQADLITARKSLTKILTSKDVKATLLELVEQNKINRSLLTLLDENIANAQKSDQGMGIGIEIVGPPQFGNHSQD
ncbi:Dimethylallyl adenosine tRNA methylthiotransferase [Citrus sinensis]|uniref:Dimethylallyl adenosine tRNA methylthiotransferase n=1 Tax=Citrus sinensis TaxID=2711 RepID=A0ACB8LVK9_CITSI|nr:Dimethylallyl adenosine tRNA methylthiotransferase [Citrus sinensis]